jgi:ubiquinone biosynthesis protein COQ9
MELSPASHRLVSPYELIAYSMRRWNAMALKEIDESEFEGKVRVREKIHYAIKRRLMKEIEYIDSWNQAMGIGAHPSNIS